MNCSPRRGRYCEPDHDRHGQAHSHNVDGDAFHTKITYSFCAPAPAILTTPGHNSKVGKNRIHAVLNPAAFLKFSQMIAVRNEKVIRKFGTRVRTLRTERKITQLGLAVDAGVPVSQISRIELGQVNASISTAHAIATALGVKLKDLMDF